MIYAIYFKSKEFKKHKGLKDKWKKYESDANSLPFIFQAEVLVCYDINEEVY